MRSARRAEGAPLGPMQPPSPIARLLSQNGPEPTGSIEAAMTLASSRSWLQKPYFKTRLAPRDRTSNAAELAQLRRNASAMKADFGKLLSTHERTEAAVVDLRQKVRQLREELGAKDKALELARRTVDRLSCDKGGLESAAAGTQAYVRKLEARLLSVRHAAQLEQRCTQLKGQLERQELSLAAAEERAAAAEASLQKLQLDVACLKRGLELAAEQLTRSAGAEVPGTLLRAVARGQEEALGLSGQLSDARQQVATLTAALEQAKVHLEAQQAALAQHQSERTELVQRTEAAEAAAEKHRAAAGELRRVLDALRPKAGALAGERDDLLQQLELERTAADDARREVKQLRATLRKKETTETALRDELRRVLAGEGVTPGPSGRGTPRGSGAAAAAAALAVQKTPRSALRVVAGAASPRAAALQSRSSSRAGSSRRPQQGAAGAPVASSHLMFIESARVHDAAGAAQADKAVSRQASAWEQQLREQHTTVEAEQQQWQLDGSGGDGLIRAVPSPTRALARLQEQRRQQQGSRLAMREQQHGGEHVQVDGKQTQRGLLNLAARLQQEQQPKLQLQFSSADAATLNAAKAVAAAQVLPMQDGQLMQLYSSALDEQIALLEGDLAQLSGAPSPIARLQKTAAAATSSSWLPPCSVAPAAGKRRSAALGKQLDAPVSHAVQQEHPQEQQAREGAIAAWRPNGAFAPEPTAEPDAATVPVQHATHGMQQRLMSSGGGNPGADGQLAPTAPSAAPVPHVWHSNPLAGSPPPKGLQLVAPPFTLALTQQQPQQQPGGEREADAWQQLLGLQPSAQELGALVTAAVAADAEPGEGALLQQQADEEWGWVGSGPASSLSLRGPRSQHGGSSSAFEAAGSQGRGGAQEAHQQQMLSMQPVLQLQQEASQGSTGGGEGGVASLSQRWDLPSPLGNGNSHWLSAEIEADIECLEVNSRPTPIKPGSQLAAAASAHGHEQQHAARPPSQQQQQDVYAAAGSSSCSAAAAQQGLQGPLASGWASGFWEASCGGSSEEEAELLQSRGAERRTHPLLPGLPLLPDASPQPGDASFALQPAALSLPLKPALVGAEEAELQQGQGHTLFDLAALDMSELMAA